MQERMLVMPATLTGTLDGPEDYWLIVRQGEDLARAFKKAQGLEGCLREHDLLRTVFLHPGNLPITGQVLDDDALLSVLDQLSLEHEEQIENRKVFEIAAEKIPEPTNDTFAIRAEGSLWIDVSPNARGGVSIELYGYPKCGNGRFYTEVPEEVVRDTLNRFPITEAA